MSLFDYITDPISEKLYNIYSKKSNKILELYATFDKSDLKFNYKHDHYIFGYGSLLLKESRNQTITSDDCIPVVLKGYKRYWGKHTTYKKKFSYSALAIKKTGNKFDKVNGILLKLNPTQMSKLDSREKGYNRVILNKKNIIDFNNKNNLNLNNSIIWSYTLDKIEIPNNKYPIIQSYLDYCILGALRISNRFAKLFIKSTFPRENALLHWNNDRLHPIRFDYKIDKKNVKKIDKLLEDNLLLFDYRKCVDPVKNIQNNSI